MVESDHTQLDVLFQALGDPTRRAMLRQLAGGEQSVTDLARPHAMSLAAASRHVKVLESAGLIRREVRWRTHMCRLDAAPLAAAHDWLAFYRQFWGERLDVLEALLRAESPAAAPALPTPDTGETT